ncbi:glycosyltransferase family 2 protein [Mucilaginibacter limnophilus]|uniref:Glycosyltransferase family 2 protein n=1 Tax=Mucilaginibacter limnophilus TaxID=1932778 RepID=A0A3S2UP06_9SPHI|nr:glycosyltransferase family A protein [Mucilaginibacter limnophilus]RVU02471.1 glycosyltransferase family 2 protein [Mucilaginibacter limnophilus]
MKQFVSVIIPVYKDWYRLALCLNALSIQTYGSKSFEIIVVNNCPHDEVPDGFYVPDNCNIINEEKPGSYAARNTGIRVAAGEIIAFTDSDCIPHPNWIENGVHALVADADYSRVAGRIKLYFNSDRLNTAELYEKIYAFNQDIYVKHDGTGVTANLFTYQHVFKYTGLFNDNLLSGGDYEWSVRARDDGFKIKYCASAVVSHPARNDMEELVIKAKRVGGGQAGFSRGNKSLVNTVVRFVYDLRPPVKSLSLILAKGKDLHIGQKFLVAYTRYYLTVITACEKFKVSLGKVAQRS